MPLSDRTFDTAVGTGSPDELAGLRERALDVLTDPALARIVELVAWADGDHLYVANAAGRSRAARNALSSVEVLAGTDPVARQDPLAFTPLPAEFAAAEGNSYPFAWQRLASLFDDPRAPDLAVVHTGAHHWPERGGHLGEHGSLAVVQSRAPLLLSGAGVRERGVLQTAARVVDVAPTLAWLAGASLSSLADLDGSALVDLVTPTGGYVVGLLWDGVNSNSLTALAESGDLPAVARLLSQGCVLAGGAIAEFPSVTLVNHTCALTGVGPGRHGIVNNSYYDRVRSETIHANEQKTWHLATGLLRDGVRTVFEMVDVQTACVDEPVDRGADYSTFALIRGGGSSDGAASMDSALPNPREDPHTTQAHVRNRNYAFGSQVDAIGLQQVLSLWESPESAPRLMWWNSMNTDTGHHEGGPHSDIAHDSMRDADRRLGAFLAHLDSLGITDQVTFLLTADHGSEGADPACTGDWDEALREAGVPFRDEAYGFIYLGHS